MKSVLIILRKDFKRLNCCCATIKTINQLQSFEQSSIARMVKRSMRSVEDNIAHKARVSDKHFEQLYEMWK